MARAVQGPKASGGFWKHGWSEQDPLRAADVVDRTGMARGQVQVWNNPLNGSEVVEFVPTAGMTRSFPSTVRLAAWLRQRRWTQQNWRPLTADEIVERLR
jgi:hypothetical protein